jgi:putative membrane protein
VATSASTRNADQVEPASSRSSQGLVKGILWLWAILAAAIGLASAVLPGFDVEEGVLGYVVVALVFGLVNAVIGPILRLLTLPITLVTLGLFALVVNGALLAIAAWITPLIELDGFLSAMVAALVISIFSAVLAYFVGRRRG